MSVRVFVYGTLQPGQSRWPTLAQYVDPRKPPIRAGTPGALYDTHCGWPAAVFSQRTARLVPGSVVAIEAGREGAALADMDEIEGVDHGLFVRTEVLAHGSVCWAYHWPGGTDGFALINAW